MKKLTKILLILMLVSCKKEELKNCDLIGMWVFDSYYRNGVLTPIENTIDSILFQNSYYIEYYSYYGFSVSTNDYKINGNKINNREFSCTHEYLDIYAINGTKTFTRYKKR